MKYISAPGFSSSKPLIYCGARSVFLVGSLLVPHRLALETPALRKFYHILAMNSPGTSAFYCVLLASHLHVAACVTGSHLFTSRKVIVHVNLVNLHVAGSIVVTIMSSAAITDYIIERNEPLTFILYIFLLLAV